jgi:hypothetical protein
MLPGLQALLTIKNKKCREIPGEKKAGANRPWRIGREPIT